MDKIKYCNECNKKQIMTFSGSGQICSCSECGTKYINKYGKLYRTHDDYVLNSYGI